MSSRQRRNTCRSVRLSLRLPGRLPRLDQPVLEHERPELRVGGPVVHDLGALGPAGGGAEVGARARAQGHRLAHVQRPAAVVPEHVHARVVRERREVGALRRRDPLGGLGLPRPPARAQQVERLRRPSPRSRTGAGTGRRTRARRSARRAAPGAPRSPRCRAPRPAAPARGGAPAGRTCARAGPCRAWAARGQSRPARSNACLSTRLSKLALCAISTRPSRSSATSGRTSAGVGAPSTIPWVMPVKRSMPRDSGRSGRTSESKVSCSSPPPTSTAPTSVSSHSSPPRPLVSVSSATNSAPATGCSSSFTEPMQSTPADGWNGALQRRGRSRPPPRLASLHGPLQHPLRLLRVRPREPQVARPLPRLRGVEHLRRGAARRRARRAPGALGQGGAPGDARGGGGAPRSRG